MKSEKWEKAWNELEKYVQTTTAIDKKNLLKKIRDLKPKYTITENVMNHQKSNPKNNFFIERFEKKIKR